MPHFSIEYSANLDRHVDIDRFCSLVSETLLSTGLFERGAVRVRAFRAERFSVADADPKNGFIDMSLRMGAGRSAEDKHRIGQVVFAVATEHLIGLFATPHFALSLEIREIDPKLSWKKNAIHPRLRGT